MGKLDNPTPPCVVSLADTFDLEVSDARDVLARPEGNQALEARDGQSVTFIFGSAGMFKVVKGSLRESYVFDGNGEFDTLFSGVLFPIQGIPK